MPATDRPYTLALLNPAEAEAVQAAGSDPSRYVIAECALMQPPQVAAQNGQIATGTARNAATGEEIPIMVFMLAVALPMEAPKILSGIIGPGGQPLQNTRMEGPPGATCRVLVPIESLSAYAKGELEVLRESKGLAPADGGPP